MVKTLIKALPYYFDESSPHNFMSSSLNVASYVNGIKIRSTTSEQYFLIFRTDTHSLHHLY